MKLVSKNVRVEKSDIVPTGANLEYHVIKFESGDVVDFLNRVKKAIATKAEDIGKVSQIALNTIDTLGAGDIADAISAILTERASDARRLELGIKKDTNKAVASRKSEVDLGTL